MAYTELTRDEAVALLRQMADEGTLTAAREVVREFWGKKAGQVTMLMVTSDSDYNDEYYTIEVEIRGFDATGRVVQPVRAYDENAVLKRLGLPAPDEDELPNRYTPDNPR